MDDVVVGRSMPGELTIPVDRRRWELRDHGAKRAGAVGIAVGLALVAGAVALLSSPGAEAAGVWAAVVALVALYAGASVWLLRARRLESGLDSIVVVRPEEVFAIESRLGVEESGYGGLGFRMSTPLRRWMVLSTIVTIIAVGALYLASAVASEDPSLAVAYVVFALYMVGGLVVIHRDGGLILTAERVLHRNWFVDTWAPFTEREVGWTRGRQPGSPHGVLRLNARAVDGSKRYRRRAWWVIVPQTQKPQDQQFLLFLAVHPVVAGETVQFYLEHPERRGELGTQAAVDRVRRAVEAAR